MNLLVVGISHRSAAVETLERLSVDAEAGARLAQRLLTGGEVHEIVVLSTCNRVEVYAAAAGFHGALSAIVDELHDIWGMPAAGSANVAALTDGSVGSAGRAEAENAFDFASCGYVRHGADAVAHTFRVAAGLDSLVAGEPQILGQLRDAYETAREADHVGRHLHELFQQALRVGKRVHAETDVDAAAPSIVTAALGLAETALDRPLSDVDAAVVGAGAMGGLATATLARARTASLAVANRDRDKAHRLAAEHGASAADYTDLAGLASGVDLLVCATAAPRPVIEAAALASRRSRLVVCDLALPRDVAEEVASLDGVTVIDIAEIQRSEAAVAGTEAIAEVERLIAEEIQAYGESLRAAAVTPTVAALRATAADIVETELARVARRGDFTDEQRAEVARTVHRVVQRLLHEPTVRVRELAGRPGAPDYAKALRELFALTPGVLAEPGDTALAEALKIKPEGDTK